MGKKKNRTKQTKASAALARALSAAKPTTEELAKHILTAPKIGLGLESKFSKINRRICREDIRFDQYTAQEPVQARYHAIYTAGWSLPGIKPE